MNPVEKTCLVAARLPTRPFLGRKRNGKGFAHHYLRFAKGRGRRCRNAKDSVYLGRLSPLQQLAVKQAIDEAWPSRRNPAVARHWQKTKELRKQYRKARKLVDLLAQRAGYHMHGNTIRRINKMTSIEDRVMDLVKNPEYAGLSADEWAKRAIGDPKQGLLDGLELLQLIDRALIFHCRQFLLAVGDVRSSMTAAGRRALTTFLTMQRTHMMLGAAILRVQADIGKETTHAS